MTRQEIHAAVWSQRLALVARGLAISETALRKACHEANVPLPSYGHWSRVRSGKAPPVPPLRGNKDEVFVPLKRDRVRAEKTEPSRTEATTPAACPEPPAGLATRSSADADSVGAWPEGVEGPFRAWLSQQQRLAFLVCLERSLCGLPDSRSARPLLSVRAAILELRRSDSVQAAVCALTKM